MTIFNPFAVQEVLRMAEGSDSPTVGDPDDNDQDDDSSEEDDDNDDDESEDDDEEDSGDSSEHAERKVKGGSDNEAKRSLGVDGDLARVSLGDIKEKFPDFFKTFPSLKHAFFREQEFTELFPTVEDAKTASEAQAAYEEIKNTVIAGDVGRFFSELGSESQEGLETFVSNFLPSLEQHNKDLYYNTLAPSVQGFIKNVYAKGKESKDDNIINAAKIVHRMLFGGDYSDIEKNLPTNGRREPDKTVEDDKRRYFGQKYQDLYSDVTRDCYGALDSEIDKGLSDLGKDKSGIKRLIAKDIRDKVLQQMDKDTAYMTRMKNLWLRESRNGFSGQLKQSFMTVFMSKARTLIGKARVEARKDALGKESTNGSGTREPNRIGGGKHSSGGGKAMTPERQKAEKLTTRQVFD